jgi:hypothetical protein
MPMAIPEAQLDTWSAQGGTGVFRQTYNHLKDTLEDPASPYARAGRKVRVFLQGSYENDSNTHGESDVDTVMMLESTFQYSLVSLNPQEVANFRAAYPADATYTYADFKREVLAWLESQYPGVVRPKSNAVHILRNGKLPREADVLICQLFKDYWAFANVKDTESYLPGVKFYDQENNGIVNYPDLHSVRVSDKHGDTGGRFKPTVRIFKNMRHRLTRDGVLRDGVAPSYYIEGLLSNIPEPNFVARHDATVLNCLRWLYACDRSTLRCAHRMSLLIGDNSPIAWPLASCNAFINGAANLWDNWR